MNRVAGLRAELGGAHPLAENKVKDHLEPYVRAFIENAPFMVMASSDGDANCDASPKGGELGFVTVLDDQTLLIPDFGGNRLFQSYENFETNPKVGLVFMIPGMDVTVRVNGRVSVHEAAELEARGVTVRVAERDDNSILVQGIVLHIDEAYFHCPRSMKFADLWNEEVITGNRSRSITSLQGDAKTSESR